MEGFDFDINFSLENKVALITGAGRGIGKSIARLFAAKGANLILIGKSNNVVKVAEEINESGRNCIPLALDITIEENINKISQNCNQ